MTSIYLAALTGPCGLGMIGGAVAASVLPKQPQVRQAVNKAADTVENAVESAKNAICG